MTFTRSGRNSLKAVVAAVELSLNPVLAAGMTEIIEVDEDGNPKPKLQRD